jgi:hypothetical protein
MFEIYPGSIMSITMRYANAARFHPRRKRPTNIKGLEINTRVLANIKTMNGPILQPVWMRY